MMSPIVKLKFGLIVSVILFGIATLITNSQLLTFYTIDINVQFINLINDLEIVAFLLLIVITYRLWKYHELCKECMVQKEMVKEKIE